ncbi:2TM domain-containing protein [Neolewinella litorea]|uniref:2TM domain-containing protein n=1 Tax=Neolewinella litorea TaxID=2562452 RepID=A0A4S4NNI0_9BACT|nr:2TM domain-containing protein [Neolewinella litorea]THH40567.1 2TM domain-containing protein [Neolewinella litorea]
MGKKKKRYELKTLREKKIDFRRHLRTYLVMCAFFIALNLLTIGSIGWAIWPILGWGIGVSMQAMSLYGPLADPEDVHPREEQLGTPLPDLEDEALDLRELERRPYRDEDLV